MNPSATSTEYELRSTALALLCETDPDVKVAGTRALLKAWQAGSVSLHTQAVLQETATLPGRPAQPELVSPRLLPRRAMTTPEGRAILMHALAHIEFNAINLALDAIWRFAAMPPEYYADWLKVAAEEALHFSLLAAHLKQVGYAYGDFTAHNSLWEMVHKTRDDVLARMALVPRTMEARGLDATPAVRMKLAQAGEHEAAAILDIILRDEVGHVAIGNYWYGWLCERQGRDVLSTYAELTRQYKAPVMRGPFNLEARRAAGFSEAELAALQAGASAA